MSVENECTIAFKPTRKIFQDIDNWRKQYPKINIITSENIRGVENAVSFVSKSITYIINFNSLDYKIIITPFIKTPYVFFMDGSEYPSCSDLEEMLCEIKISDKNIVEKHNASIVDLKSYHNSESIDSSDIIVLLEKNKYLITPNSISKPLLCEQIETGWRFVHIPKTGGTFVEMRAALAGIRWGWWDVYNFKRGDIWHNPPDKIPELYPKDTKLFAIVRHPYARMISAAKYHYTFGNKIETLTNQRLNEIIAYQMKIKGKHFVPQTNLTHSSRSVNKIFKYEDGFEKIQEFFDQEGIKIDLSGDEKILSLEGKFNLTPATKKLIYRYHKSDFNTFGYNHNFS